MNSVENYVNASAMQYRDAKDIIEEFEYEISMMRGRCIDIGCGPAITTKELILPRLSPDTEIVGADICASMLEYARRTYRDDKRMSFIHLDIETPVLPINEIERYDNLVSFYCLHWCQPRNAFKNIYKLLRPGGRALFAFLGYNNGFDAYTRMRHNPLYQPYMQDASRYIPYFQHCQNSRAYLRGILEEVGFKILHCSSREKTYTYKNQQTFQNHMIAINPFISRIPDEMKREFADDIMREVMSQKILLPKKSDDNQDDHHVLDIYHLLIAYIEKPQS